MLIEELTNKKHLLGVFPSRDISSFQKKVIQILQSKKYEVQVKKGRLHVKKNSSIRFPDSISAPAVDLYFKQKGNKIEVYWTKSITTQAMIMSLIRPVLPESSSDFAKKEILPILQQHL